MVSYTSYKKRKAPAATGQQEPKLKYSLLFFSKKPRLTVSETMITCLQSDRWVLPHCIELPSSAKGGRSAFPQQEYGSQKMKCRVIIITYANQAGKYMRLSSYAIHTCGSKPKSALKLVEPYPQLKTISAQKVYAC